MDPNGGSEGVPDDSDGADGNAKSDSDGRQQKQQPSQARIPSSLVVGLVVAVGVAAFFMGIYVSGTDRITQDDLDDALAKLELRIMQGQMPTGQPPQPPPQPVIISADDDPVIGDLGAPITIIEFSDFQCPFCARFVDQTLPDIQEQYIDKGLVKLVFRDFPIQNIHPNALVTSLASECADDQGRFKEMHDIIFENQRQWSQQSPAEIMETLNGYAESIQLDQDTFEQCVVGGTHIDDVRGDLRDGRDYGVTGTPGFFVGNDELGYVPIMGAQPFESFKTVIDTQLLGLDL